MHALRSNRRPAVVRGSEYIQQWLFRADQTGGQQHTQVEVTAAEFEEMYYEVQEGSATTAWLSPPQSLRESRGDSRIGWFSMKAHTVESQATTSPARALEFLKEGNARFIANLRVNRNLLQQANETRDGQWPFATIVSCIDSRTSAELIFDQGLGDIFSVRIAGNVVNTDIIGSLEFACQVAGSRMIVVLGHTQCGAIKGACDHVELGNLTELLSKIQPAVYEESETKKPTDRNSNNARFVENVADLNIRRSVRSIVNRSYILEHLIEDGKAAIIGAKHDLSTGRVEFFDDTWVHDLDSIRNISGRVLDNGESKSKAN
jgi:carbonic anhydrase